MDVNQILEKARDTLTVHRVFGDPIERDGTVIVPVARVRGSAGAGGGSVQQGAEGGGGWVAQARPAGVYVISGGDVRWQPAVDVNRIVLGAQVCFVIGLLVLRSIVHTRALRR